MSGASPREVVREAAKGAIIFAAPSALASTIKSFKDYKQNVVIRDEQMTNTLKTLQLSQKLREVGFDFTKAMPEELLRGNPQAKAGKEPADTRPVIIPTSLNNAERAGETNQAEIAPVSGWRSTDRP